MGSLISALAVAGPTASGKSSLALQLAKKFGGEIINCDSIAVYQGFDVGSGKPSHDELAECRHHLISTLPAEEDFDAGRFMLEGAQIVRELAKRGVLPVVVGGTGLYLRALFNGLAVVEKIAESTRGKLAAKEAELSSAELLPGLYAWLTELDPGAAQRLHPNDISRIRRALLVKLQTGDSIQRYHQTELPPLAELRSALLVLLPDREWLYSRADERVEGMLAKGLVAEVEGLLTRHSADTKPFGSIGYRHVVQYLRGEVSYPAMVELLKRDTRRFAKRQYTWWRHQPAHLGWKVGETVNCRADELHLKAAEVSQQLLALLPQLNDHRVLCQPIQYR